MFSLQFCQATPPWLKLKQHCSPGCQHSKRRQRLKGWRKGWGPRWTWNSRVRQPNKTPRWGEIHPVRDETKRVLQGTAQHQLTHCPPQQQLWCMRHYYGLIKCIKQAQITLGSFIHLWKPHRGSPRSIQAPWSCQEKISSPRNSIVPRWKSCGIWRWLISINYLSLSGFKLQYRNKSSQKGRSFYNVQTLITEDWTHHPIFNALLVLLE